MNAQQPEPLTKRQQAIVTISALMAKGYLPHLHTALASGLAIGLTIVEEKKVLAQLCAYCGFPEGVGAGGNHAADPQRRKPTAEVGRAAQCRTL